MNNSETETNYNNDVLKDITEVIKNQTVGDENEEINSGNGNSSFKVCENTLPEKTSFWTKVKNVMLYEIKIELTPYQQKIENEINEFLHQEITWGKVRDFLFQEVPITYKGKRIF